MQDKTPAPREMRHINVIGFVTLVQKEVGRFLSVYMQTIIAPMITTLLFYTVFSLALGGADRTVGEVPYLLFLAPGLVMMSMVQNAFANTSSSLVISKVQGNIVDVLMPPLSAAELFSGYMVGGVLRGLSVGLASALLISLFVPIGLYSPFHVLAFALLGTMMLASLGIIGGIWSEKFDHIAAVTNFIIMPLTFLSGTFYSLSSLPGMWRDIAFYNPFFHAIDGFRYGLTGHADGDVMTGLWLLAAVNASLIILGWAMIRSGYKIKS